MLPVLSFPPLLSSYVRSPQLASLGLVQNVIFLGDARVIIYPENKQLAHESSGPIKVNIKNQLYLSSYIRRINKG